MRAAIFSLFISFSTFARVDDVLPEGVRMFVTRQVKTNTVRDYRNESGNLESYSTRIKLDSKFLSEVDVLNDFLLDDLKAQSPEAFNALLAGTYKIDVKANVDVSAFALGYGLNPKTTLYAVVPYYSAKISSKLVREEGNTYELVSDLVKKSGNKTGFTYDWSSLPDADEGLIQSAITNLYGYQGLGNWEGSGIGDIELGVKYKISEWTDGGAVGVAGMIIPTGRIDSPDILQDIGFGKGFWTAFLETGVGQSYKRSDFNFYVRGELSLPATKSFRPIYEDSDLTDELYSYDINPGFKFLTSISYTYHLSSWINAYGGLIYEYKAADDFQSTSGLLDKGLERYSEWNSTTLALGVEITSIQAFLDEKFLLPGSLGFKFDKVIAGKNTPNTTLYALELRLLF